MDQTRRLKRLGKLAATFLGKDRQDIGTSHLLTSDIQNWKIYQRSNQYDFYDAV